MNNGHPNSDVLIRLRSAFIARRIALGLTQIDLALRMDTSQSHISDLETGRTDARLSTWMRWAQALDWTLRLELVREAHVDPIVRFPE